MPRSNREYLLRYADQAINDMERALDRLQLLSEAYAGRYKPLEGAIEFEGGEEETAYVGAHAKHQQFVDVNASLLITVRDNITLFKQNYM